MFADVHVEQHPSHQPLVTHEIASIDGCPTACQISVHLGESLLSCSMISRTILTSLTQHMVRAIMVALCTSASKRPEILENYRPIFEIQVALGSPR